MDEQSGLIASEPENEQPTAGVAFSKSDNSSLKSTQNLYKPLLLMKTMIKQQAIQQRCPIQMPQEENYSLDRQKPTALMLINTLTKLAKIGRRNRFPTTLNGGVTIERFVSTCCVCPLLFSLCCQNVCIFSKSDYIITARKSNLSLNIVKGGEFLRSYVDQFRGRITTRVEIRVDLTVFIQI